MTSLASLASVVMPCAGPLLVYKTDRRLRRPFVIADYTHTHAHAHTCTRACARAHPPNACRRPSILMMVYAVRLGTYKLMSRKESPSPHFLASGIFARDHTPRAHTETHTHVHAHTHTSTHHTHTDKHTHTHLTHTHNTYTHAQLIHTHTTRTTHSHTHTHTHTYTHTHISTYSPT